MAEEGRLCWWVVTLILGGAHDKSISVRVFDVV